ncbi:hypothetical protein E2C01_002401 [Portunus trituberculatus]|uniref:Uncharacterized protein n=1 Tax=Portunus trituberculatus TaxID=210409 RepID=A0A5B7CJA0_PORTR|nr:hypothetical protein [Portunus trituberculatus]
MVDIWTNLSEEIVAAERLVTFCWLLFQPCDTGIQQTVCVPPGHDWSSHVHSYLNALDRLTQHTGVEVSPLRDQAAGHCLAHHGIYSRNSTNNSHSHTTAPSPPPHCHLILILMLQVDRDFSRASRPLDRQLLCDL